MISWDFSHLKAYSLHWRHTCGQNGLRVVHHLRSPQRGQHRGLRRTRCLRHSPLEVGFGSHFAGYDMTGQSTSIVFGCVVMFAATSRCAWLLWGATECGRT